MLPHLPLPGRHVHIAIQFLSGDGLGVDISNDNLHSPPVVSGMLCYVRKDDLNAQKHTFLRLLAWRYGLEGEPETPVVIALASTL